MNKNLKYGLIFTGVVAGSYLIVKIIQNLRGLGKSDAQEAEDLLAGLEKTGGSTNTNQTKFIPSFKLSKKNSNVKKLVEDIQSYQNEAVDFAKEGKKVTVDGFFGYNTYTALRDEPLAIRTSKMNAFVSNPTEAGAKELKRSIGGELGQLTFKK
mgnify:CR=1 FL=1